MFLTTMTDKLTLDRVLKEQTAEFDTSDMVRAYERLANVRYLLKNRPLSMWARDYWTLVETQLQRKIEYMSVKNG